MRLITSSVGRGGINRASDVKIVQQLLNSHPIRECPFSLNEDGAVGAKTIRKIEAFQRHVFKTARPDGRIEPNSRCLALLAPKATAAVKVSYAADVPKAKQLVSEFAKSVVRLALLKSDMQHAVITSTLRTPDEQARIMYKHAKKNLSEQFKLYGATGDEVLKVYKSNSSASEDVAVKLMQEKIEALLSQGRRTSNHVVTQSQYNKLNIFDVGVNSTRAVCGGKFNIKKFTQELEKLKNDGYINVLIDETDKSNSCWHLEIEPNKKKLPTLETPSQRTELFHSVSLRPFR